MIDSLEESGRKKIRSKNAKTTTKNVYLSKSRTAVRFKIIRIPDLPGANRPMNESRLLNCPRGG